MLTSEAGGLPTCFVNFESSCASRPQTSPTAKWQIAETVPLNTGLSWSTSDIIDLVGIARIARLIDHCDVFDIELGSNREKLSHS